MTFGASPKKAKLKDKKKKRKFLESPALGQNAADTRRSSRGESAGPVIRSANAGSSVPESECVERALFPASRDTKRTLEKHEKEIHAIHDSLWTVHSAIANLQLDSCKNHAMTRLLLESVSVPQELIDQRLAIATAHSQEQLRAKGNQQVPQQAPDAAITDAAGSGGSKRDTDDLMDDEQDSLDPETHVPVSRLTIAVLQKFLRDNGMAEEAVNSLPKRKKQLLYSISWSIPQGLPIVVSVLQWPEKTKHLEAKMAKVVGLVSGALVWSSNCGMQMDPTTPVTALPNPQTATPANNEGVYVLGLEDVYLRIESAEKRASRNMQPAKKQALTDSPNVTEVSAGGAATPPPLSTATGGAHFTSGSVDAPSL